MNSTKEAVQIRRMAAADLPRVLEIAASVKEAPHWPQAAYLDALSPESIPRRIALVAATQQPGTIQSFTVASLIPPQAELETIAVNPGSRRRGLGRLLFDALAGELQAAGISELILEVRASNQPALDFYRTLGFIKTGRRPSYYVDPMEDAVLMRLRFG